MGAQGCELRLLLVEVMFLRFDFDVLFIPPPHHPCNKVAGGILESSCPSVYLWRRWFLSSRMLPFSPRVTLSHIWTTHGKKNVPYWIWGPKVKHTGQWRKNTVSRLKNVILSIGVTISHIWTTHGRKMFPIEFGIKTQKVKHTGHQSRNTVSWL
jgi:hypothetical protein